MPNASLCVGIIAGYSLFMWFMYSVDDIGRAALLTLDGKLSAVCGVLTVLVIVAGTNYQWSWIIYLILPAFAGIGWHYYWFRRWQKNRK